MQHLQIDYHTGVGQSNQILAVPFKCMDRKTLFCTDICRGHLKGKIRWNPTIEYTK